MDKMTVYNHLPVWGQNLACYVEGRRIKATRFGDVFWKKLKEYEGRNGWSYERICEYRDDRLKDMIAYCYEYVPYYRRLMDDSGVNPAIIKSIDDLKQLPILTKEEVKKNIAALRSTAMQEDRIVVCPTGGTTGSGLRFLSTNEETAEQWAVWWRYRRRNGINFTDRCGVFGGKQVVPLAQKRKPYWRHNRPNNQEYFSSYHITGESVGDYAEYIGKSNIGWLHGYASSITDFADRLAEAGIRLPMRWVTTGSENLYDYQKEKIERAFGVVPIQHYGLTEGVANFSEHGGVLNVDEDFSCVEFVPTDNVGEYRIVGTALTKFAMPLVRYDTGDVAVIEQPGSHVNGGRAVKSIGGRSVEYVALPGGGKVGAAAISLAIHDYHFIRNMQVVQNDIHSVVVNIETNEYSDDYDEKALLHSLRERFGVEVDVSLKYVRQIPREKNGKHRLVISNI